MPDQPTTPRKRTVKAAADPLAIIRGARLPEKIVPLCLRPDLQAELDLAAVELADLIKRPDAGSTLAQDPAIVAANARVTELIEQMRAHVVNFRFRAISRPEHKAAIVKYPPRPGDAADEKVGYNTDAVESYYVRTGCVEPDLSEDDWAALEENLTPYQWDQLLAACDQIAHNEATSVPFL